MAHLNLYRKIDCHKVVHTTLYFGDAGARKGVKFELKTALTYSPTQGLEPLEKFIHDWSGLAQKPALSVPFNRLFIVQWKTDWFQPAPTGIH